MIAPVSRSTPCCALCAGCVRPSFILVIFASGSRGCVQSFEPLFNVVASMPRVSPVTNQSCIRQPLWHPGEDRLVRLEIGSATGPGSLRVIRRVSATPAQETRAAQTNPRLATQSLARNASPRSTRSAVGGSSGPAATRPRRIAHRVPRRTYRSRSRRGSDSGAPRTALCGRSCVATPIDACFTCRFRLPVAVRDSVVR